MEISFQVGSNYQQNTLICSKIKKNYLALVYINFKTHIDKLKDSILVACRFSIWTPHSFEFESFFWNITSFDKWWCWWDINISYGNKLQANVHIFIFLQQDAIF
jgi:hypothetical protein